MFHPAQYHFTVTPLPLAFPRPGISATVWVRRPCWALQNPSAKSFVPAEQVYWKTLHFLAREQSPCAIDQNPQFFRVVCIIIDHHPFIILDDVFEPPFHTPEWSHSCSYFYHLQFLHASVTAIAATASRYCIPHIQFNIFLPTHLYFQVKT